MTSRILAASIILTALTPFSSGYCETKLTTRETDGGGIITISLDTGRSWKHTLMKIMGVIPIKTTPQIAVWLENENGDFITTLYVTQRYATQNWRKTPGDAEAKENIKRPQALPYWAQKNKNLPNGSAAVFPDAITSASPEESFTLESRLGNTRGRIAVLLEINNSADFNDYYRRDAALGDRGYSGGQFGSGQPSLIYRAIYDSSSSAEPLALTLIGHGSPKGEDGELYTDISHITTARDIVSRITAIITNTK